MATPIAKLRRLHNLGVKERDAETKIAREFKADERKMKKSANVVVAPKNTDNDEYNEKLNRTIENARAVSRMNIQNKRTMIVLDKTPIVQIPSVVVAVAPVITICKARNINGTPCKCKATKLGKFCTKHAP